jgi:PAS domain S-box-containing protein
VTVEASKYVQSDETGSAEGGSAAESPLLRQSETALRKREQRYRSLVLATASLVWMTDPIGHIVEPSPAWTDFTGQCFEQYRGLGWLDAVHPDDRGHVRDVWMETLRSQRVVQVEYRLRNRDGTWHHMLVCWAPVLDEQGRLYEWVAACTDIHDRVRVADALREEVRITDILHSIGMAVAAELDLQRLAQRVIDASTSVTRAGCGVLFHPTSDEGGAPVTMRSLSGPEATALAEFAAPRHRQLANHRGLRADDITHDPRFAADTAELPILPAAAPVRSLMAVPIVSRSGDVLGAMVFGHRDPAVFTSRDERVVRGIASQAAIAIDNAQLVRDLRLAQQRLAGQLGFTRSITDSLGEGLYAVDVSGRATFVNPAAEKMLGYAADEMAGKDMHDLIHFKHPDLSDFPKDSCPLLSVIRTGTPVSIDEDAFVRRNGSTFPVSYTSSPTYEDGKITGAVVAFRDETERKAAEAAVRRYSEELERLVTERTAELEQANSQLRVSNRELQDFASVASHDLQEPLRKIQAFGDRLLAKVGPTLGAEGQDYLYRMRNAAGRMQSLISDLLAFSRVTTKAQPFAPVDLAEIVGEVLSDLETTIEQTGGRVEVGPLPRLDADAMQMRQLVQNLLGNALKFHKPGVAPLVKLYAEVNAPTEAGATCRLIVEDNGIGFDEKYLDRIFNVFQRLHGRGTYEGTGIGLAVCRKIAERHGGSITAQSALGVGSKFVVILPLKQNTTEGPNGE